MGKHLNSRVRAIRLSNELWGRIEAEADGLDMSVNEFVRRRLAKSFERVQENEELHAGILGEEAPELRVRPEIEAAS